MLARLMGIRSISPRELYAQLRDPNLTIVDVNALESWSERHVPGALHLGHDTFEANDLPPDKHARLIFYCSNPLCRKAPTAARRAKRMGYPDVRVLTAGINGWVSVGLPTESRS